MKRLSILLIALGLLLTTGVAMAQSTFTVPFAATNNSTVDGYAVLTMAGKGTDINLNFTGLAPNSAAIANLHAGTCDMPSASFSRLPGLNSDATGKATASGQILFHDTDPVALQDVADGQHVIAIYQGGQMVSCGWIPQMEPLTQPGGMPRTGGSGSNLDALAFVAVALVIVASGIMIRRKTA